MGYPPGVTEADIRRHIDGEHCDWCSDCNEDCEGPHRYCESHEREARWEAKMEEYGL